MEKSVVYEQRSKVLESFRDIMTESGIQAAFSPYEESRVPGGVLSALFGDIGSSGDREVAAEFFFHPLFSDEDETQFFAAVFNIADGTERGRADEIAKGLVLMNYYLPLGSFGYDEESGILVFKLTCPMPARLDTEALHEQVDTVIGSSLNTVAGFADIVTQLAEGMINAPAVRRLFEEPV